MSKAKKFLKESNVKGVLQDYTDQLTKIGKNLGQEYRQVAAEIEKVVSELGKQDNYDQVSKITSALSDAQSDLAFYVKSLRTVILDLENED